MIPANFQTHRGRRKASQCGDLGSDVKVFSNGLAAHFPDHSINDVVMEVDGLKNYGEEWQRRRRQHRD